MGPWPMIKPGMQGQANRKQHAMFPVKVESLMTISTEGVESGSFHEPLLSIAPPTYPALLLLKAQLLIRKKASPR